MHTLGDIRVDVYTRDRALSTWLSQVRAEELIALQLDRIAIVPEAFVRHDQCRRIASF